MVADDMTLEGVGLPADLWPLIRDQLAAALGALDLTAEFGAVRLTADDLPGDDLAWYRLLPAASHGGRPLLEITCHVDSFCRLRHLQTTVYPAQAIWDQVDAPLMPQLPDLSSYSADRTDMFLHHHLLTILDLRRGVLRGRDVPSHLLEAFAAAWAVVIDGRLGRRHLPGYGVAERRSRFSRLFSTGGILLPEHWEIFESLWDGALADEAAVIGAVRRLPHL